MKHKIPLKSALVTALSFALIAVSPLALAETPQEAISRANAMANADRYPEAIGLYEQVLKQLPNQPVLKDNLAALYVNYGVQLQNEKKYPEANVQFDKALTLDPNERHAKNGKAGSYFYLALDLRDKLKASGNTDYTPVYELFDKAIALNPDERAFQKAKVSTYAEEAYVLADQKRYDEAEAVLLKARALEPDDAMLKTSLANVYLGKANLATTPEERNQWAEKAIATDDTPRIQDTAHRIMDRGKVPQDGAQALSFGNNGAQALTFGDMNKGFTGKKVKKRPSSIQDMLLDVENELGIERDTRATLMQRLETAETQVYGKPQEGALAARAENLYEGLLGSSEQMATGPDETQFIPVESSANSYLDKIFEVTDGKVIRWGKFPLRVYIEDPNSKDKDKDKDKKAKKEMEPIDYVRDDISLPQTPEEEWDTPEETQRKATVKNLYNDDYRQAVIDALDAWKTATDGFTNYVVVKNPGAADVQFLWAVDYTDEFADPDDVPDVYTSYKPPSKKKKNMMRVLQLASMFTPGYFSIAPQAIGSALQYSEFKKLDAIRDESKVSLGLKPVSGLSPESANTLIRNMAAKEFAHVLGLKAASPEEGDITYPQLRSDAIQDLSRRDLETLRQLYSRPANIILNVQ